MRGRKERGREGGREEGGRGREGTKGGSESAGTGRCFWVIYIVAASLCVSVLFCQAVGPIICE